jgi:hypothetical protein
VEQPVAIGQMVRVRCSNGWAAPTMKFGKSDAKINREAPDRASEADLLNIINEARTIVQSGKKPKRDGMKPSNFYTKKR